MLKVVRVLLGYSPHTKAYKVYNKRTMCVEESIHVIFYETNYVTEKGIQADDDGEFGPTQTNEEQSNQGHPEDAGE